MSDRPTITVSTLRKQIDELTVQLADAKKELENVKHVPARKVMAMVVSGFHEGDYPQYRQGMPEHELETAITADEANNLVKLAQDRGSLILELAERNPWYRVEDGFECITCTGTRPLASAHERNNAQDHDEGCVWKKAHDTAEEWKL
jgi:hypothetical protein